MNNCPCNNCICVPICRLKQYQFLVQECKLVFEYLVNPFAFCEKERPNGKLGLLRKALNPTMWVLTNDENNKVMVDNYTGYERCHLIY